MPICIIHKIACDHNWNCSQRQHYAEARVGWIAAPQAKKGNDYGNDLNSQIEGDSDEGANMRSNINQVALVGKIGDDGN